MKTRIEILLMINIKYNESIASMLSLSGNCSFFNLGFTRTKVSNNNDGHLSTS